MSGVAGRVINSSPRIARLTYYNLLLTEYDNPADINEVMRKLCLDDLFFLLFKVLRRPDVNKDWVYKRVLEVQSQPDGYIDLWARGHWKSSIITFGKTIQDVLKNSDETFGLFSYTRGISKAFLRQIKREFEENECLKDLFPEVLWRNPSKEAPKWSEDDGLVLNRKSNPKESTIEAWGLVDSQPIGRHFSKMVFDDVVTQYSVATPEQIRKTTESWELSLNLSARGGVKRYVGTRYHLNDTYRTIIERGEAKERRYPATEDGTATGEPVVLTREELVEMRRTMGPHVFAAQMLLNPVAEDSQGFDAKWLKHWTVRNVKGMNIYILVDAASSKKKGSDYTAMPVIGLGADRNYYLIDLIRDRLNLTERGHALFELHKKYRPMFVGYERFGLMADIEYLKEKMDRENYRFDITELKNPMNKNDRIRRLIPDFEQGRWYIPEFIWKKNYEGKNVNLTREFIDEEYVFFPVATHDDILDAMSRIKDEQVMTVWPVASGSGFTPKRKVGVMF